MSVHHLFFPDCNSRKKGAIEQGSLIDQHSFLGSESEVSKTLRDGAVFLEDSFFDRHSLEPVISPAGCISDIF